MKTQKALKQLSLATLFITFTTVSHFAFAQFEGGANGGGGGNTINISVEEAKFRLKNIKEDLRIVAHRAKFWLEPDHISTYSPGQPLNKNNSEYYIGLEFLTHPLFLETVEKMTVQISDGDCKDLQGVSDDGSSDMENMSICLSAKRLSKIPAQSFNAESLALAAHEVSHLMGEGEETAVLIQKFLIWRKNLLNTNPSDYKDLIYRAGSALFCLPNVDVLLNSKDEAQNACFDIATIVERVNSIFPWSTSGNDSILPSNHPLSMESNPELTNALIEFENMQSDCRTSRSFSVATIKRLKSDSEIISKGLKNFMDFVIRYDSPNRRLQN